MIETISMKCSLRSHKEEVALQELSRYCSMMRIELGVTSVNGDALLTFTANDQQLTEVREYLESRLWSMT